MSIFSDELYPVGSNNSIVLWGQSQASNYSSLTFNSSGEKSLSQTFTALSGSELDIINSGDGSSYLLKSAYDATNAAVGGTLQANDYWIDDDSGMVAGQRLIDAMADIVSAGKATSDISYLGYLHGESEATAWVNSYVTESAMKAGLQWLVDYAFLNLPSLRKFVIQPIGRHGAANNEGYGIFRRVQREVSEEDARVLYGCETLDIELHTDDIHRSEDGYRQDAERMAYSIVKNWGSIDTTCTLSNGVIKVQSSQPIASSDGSIFTGSNIDITHTTKGLFSLYDASDTEIPITTVEITSPTEVTITPSITLVSSNNILYYGRSSMLNVELDTAVYDRRVVPFPIKTFDKVINGSIDELETMPNIVHLLTPDSAYNTGNTGTDDIIWQDKIAGVGFGGQKHGDNPTPIWASDGGMSLSHAGWYSDGVAEKKLLVKTSLTASDNYSVYVVATPDHDAVDPTTGSSSNALITTGGVSTSDAPLFGVGQTRDNLGKLSGLFDGDSGAIDTYNSVTTVISMVRNGSTVTAWDLSGLENTYTGLGSPDIESYDSSNVFAIGNDVDLDSGADSVRAFIGSIHYIVIFDVAHSDAQRSQIQNALANLVGL